MRKRGRHTMDARAWFHSAAWFGLAATASTNWQAAPTAELRVGYLAVPVLLAFVSEGLIRLWSGMPAAVRTLLSVLAFALVCTSYEHFVHMIDSAGGTWFAAWVGGAVIDVTIFGCVLATAILAPGVARGVAPVLAVAAERDTATPDATPRHLERDTTATPRHLSATPERDTATPELQSATPTATPRHLERDTATPKRDTSATDATARATLRDTYGDTRPGLRAAARTLGCADRRAKRLITLEYGANGDYEL